MKYYVTIGSTVKYKDEFQENEVKLVDVEPRENEVSVKSPVGKALLGATVGEKQTVEADELYEIEIMEIKNGTTKNIKKEKELKARALKDKDCLFAGIAYGTHSREVYKTLCDKLDWDKTQIDKFGQQGTPLFAESADTDRCRDVWFLSHLNNYIGEIKDILNKIDLETLDVASGNGAMNFIDSSKTIIVEYISKEKWLNTPKNKERITFAKTNESYSYEFLGVYELIDIIGNNSFSRRIYKLKSKVYPINLLDE